MSKFNNLEKNSSSKGTAIARSQLKVNSRSEPTEFEFSLVNYGVQIRVCTNDIDIAVRVPSYLPPGCEVSSSSAVSATYALIASDRADEYPYHLYRLGEKRAATTTLDALLDTFDSDLRLTIAMAARDKVFVHAGVVGWHGRAIAIPGRSFSGKTTLVAALVKAGATYYSDEYAVLDTEGRVHPYPRPLSVRQSTGSRVKRVPAEDLGGAIGTEPIPVGAIVRAQYEAGAEWQPTLLSDGRAVLALLDNTVIAQLRPDFALPILSKVASAAISVEGMRGEADKTAVALLQQLSARIN